MIQQVCRSALVIETASSPKLKPGEAMVITQADMLLRMGIAVVLGSAIGYERERHGRPAGLRTHLLVSLASATFMLVSTQFVYYQNYGKDDLVAIDTSRIAASVVAGVGFLGAGAILRTGISVQGLTTAASLWLVAAVGLAAGGGMFLVAVAATAVTLIGLVVLRRIEDKQWRIVLRRITITLADGGLSREEVVGQLRSLGAIVSEVGYDSVVRTKTSRLLLDVRLPNEEAVDQMVLRLEAAPGVQRVKVQRPSA